MRLPITRQILKGWAGDLVFNKGLALFESGRATDVRWEPPLVKGTLQCGPRGLLCEFRVTSGGGAESMCPCRDNTERGMICAHVIALGLQLIHIHTDPERKRKAAEERRHAERMQRTGEESYLRRTDPGDETAVPARIRLTLPPDWVERFRQGKVPLQFDLHTPERAFPLDKAPRDRTYALAQSDDALLHVLEDIAGGPPPGRLDLQPPDFLNVLDVVKGRQVFTAGGNEPVRVNPPPMESLLRMDLDRENGELLLFLETPLPFEEAGVFPEYLVHGKRGWAFQRQNLWPLKYLLPEPLREIYRHPISIDREHVPRFLQTELPMLESHLPVRSEISPEMFSLDAAQPRFRLEVRGSPASLCATLYADYGPVSLVADKDDAAGSFALPDPDDLLRYLVRNRPAEADALARLRETGLRGAGGDELSAITGARAVLNFLGTCRPLLKRRGWKVNLSGQIAGFAENLGAVIPLVRVAEGGSSSEFDVSFTYEDTDGESLSEADIQRALLMGDSFVERRGKTVLLDSDAIESARDIFADCTTREGRQAGTFRLGGIYGAYVQSALHALDGIDVETPPEWLRRARLQNRADQVAAEPLSPGMEATLRPYQKQGVYWLRFLERNGMNGILADEMGLGKTLQALAWMELPRVDKAARERPVLLVCPTSLVENWQEEALRFSPGIRTLNMTGHDRHDRWERIEQADLVLTSYALIRRDAEAYAGTTFSALVLDEAQHIKNRSTRNAKAAKSIAAANRLVLTGTPLENSVADLWSIMDFLMPGYLGHHRRFRESYELPISKGGPDAEHAQNKLRLKLKPFLLRREKREVARDLPPKIKRVAYCPLTPDQQKVYKQIMEHSRKRISGLVADKGFERSRMEIFKTLLRLRQTCCHLDLLKLQGVESRQPSAKMDLFFELLAETVDGGSRALVFSQFTTMLGIIRRGLEERGLDFCYLDGSTKERLGIVRRFNTDRSIPVFLISLKAGGTGLNLTGADVVIHFDPWWNPAVEDQATDRAYRIGQKRTVYSIKLITRGTVEEKVLAMQKRKQDVIDNTLQKGTATVPDLSWSDVQELLDLRDG